MYFTFQQLSLETNSDLFLMKPELELPLDGGGWGLNQKIRRSSQSSEKIRSPPERNSLSFWLFAEKKRTTSSPSFQLIQLTRLDDSSDETEHVTYWSLLQVPSPGIQMVGPSGDPQAMSRVTKS